MTFLIQQIISDLTKTAIVFHISCVITERTVGNEKCTMATARRQAVSNKNTHVAVRLLKMY